MKLRIDVKGNQVDAYDLVHDDVFILTDLGGKEHIGVRLNEGCILIREHRVTAFIDSEMENDDDFRQVDLRRDLLCTLMVTSND